MIFDAIKSDGRSGLVVRNILWLGGIKGLSIVTGLLLIPLTINYISSETYGIWLTLTSIVGWASFFDVGFGNGMRNRLAECLANDDYEKGRKYVSTTYFFICAIFSTFTILMLLIIPYLDWNSLLNVEATLPWNTLMGIVITLFSLQFVCNLITTVLTAMQKSAMASLLTTIGQVAVLIGIYILTLLSSPNLIYLALCLMGLPVLILIISSLYFYWVGSARMLKPTIKSIDISLAKDILKLGGKFFIIQICVILLYQTTNVIILRICGPNDVTCYNIAFKYFSVITMVSNLVLTPMWSAYTDAYTKKDYGWMSKVYSKLLQMFLIATIIAVVMYILSPWVYSVWIGDSVSMPLELSLVMMIYMVVMTWTGIHSALLNGIGKIRLSMYLTFFTILICIPLAVTMGKWLGVVGIVASTIIVNLPFTIVGCMQTKKILAQRDGGIWGL